MHSPLAQAHRRQGPQRPGINRFDLSHTFVGAGWRQFGAVITLILAGGGTEKIDETTLVGRVLRLWDQAGQVMGATIPPLAPQPRRSARWPRPVPSAAAATTPGPVRSVVDGGPLRVGRHTLRVANARATEGESAVRPAAPLVSLRPLPRLPTSLRARELCSGPQRDPAPSAPAPHPGVAS